MAFGGTGGRPRHRVGMVALVTGLFVLGLLFSGTGGGRGVAPLGPAFAQPAGSLSVSIYFSPSSVSVNTQTTGYVSISGGTSPFSLWLNNSPPGCTAPSTPYVESDAAFNFTCQPTSTGSYEVQLGVVDSEYNTGSSGTSLSVTTGSGDQNSGSGGNNSSSNNSFSIPSGLLTLAILFGAVFLVAMIILAVGAVLTAVMVSRRLRQLTEAIEKANAPSGSGKSPP